MARASTEFAAENRSMGFARMASAPFGTTAGAIGGCILLGAVIVAAFAPWLAPYDPFATHYGSDGQVLRLAPPSAAHLLGTTYYGLDVLSQLVYGARIVLIVGVACAILIGI